MPSNWIQEIMLQNSIFLVFFYVKKKMKLTEKEKRRNTNKKIKLVKREKIEVIVPSSSSRIERVDSLIHQAKWIYSTSQIIYSYLSSSIKGCMASIRPNQASFHVLCVTLRADIHCPSVFIYPKRFRCVSHFGGYFFDKYFTLDGFSWTP